MEKVYWVTVSYTIDVTAKDEQDAIRKAYDVWDDEAPRKDEMNIEVVDDESKI